MIKEMAIIVGVQEGYSSKKVLQVALTKDERDKVLAFISALQGGQIKLHEQECLGITLGSYSPVGWENLRDLIRQSNEQCERDMRDAQAYCEANGIPIEPQGEQE